MGDLDCRNETPNDQGAGPCPGVGGTWNVLPLEANKGNFGPSGAGQVFVPLASPMFQSQFFFLNKTLI